MYPRTLAIKSRDSSVSQDGKFLQELKAQSAFSVNNRGILTPKRNQIFFHKFKNNVDFVTIFSGD